MANRFVQAPSHGGSYRSGQPTLIVIHSLEAPARRGLAWDLANGWIKTAVFGKLMNLYENKATDGGIFPRRDGTSGNPSFPLSPTSTTRYRIRASPATTALPIVIT